MEIYFVTKNENKIKEINDLLRGTGITVLNPASINFHADVEETGSTFEENAILKAKTVYDIIHKPVFAEDSGLEVHSLRGEPGVRSARYAGESRSDFENIEKVLKNLKEFENRRAQFKTVVAFIHQNTIKTFTGIVEGNILWDRKGKDGFGYDPIFQPDGYDFSFAEMSRDQKNSISHRGKAIRQFLDYIDINYGLNK